MVSPVVFKLKNDIREIRKMRDGFFKKAQEICLSEDNFNAIAVSLEEILLNIMTHGYGAAVDAHIHVAIFFQPEQIKIKIQDRAGRFNPLAYKAVNLEQYFEEHPSGGGLGIHLVRELMDEISYQRKNGENIVIMKKSV